MSANEKVDLFKLNKDEYAARPKPARVKVKPATYLAVDGSGGRGGVRGPDR